MGMAEPGFSIVVRAFNEEEHIGRLLEGIARQTVAPLDIVVVDSGSTDATLSIAAHYPVRIVSIRPEEFSFGRSLNRGCEQARGRVLVFASAHVYPVYPDWLELLLSPFDDPAIALAYGKQRGGPTTRFSEHRVFAKWYPDRSVPRQTHPFCNNANAAIRRSLWEQHGYDEDLPGLEDLAWASWAIGGGHALAYVAEAEVVHVHQESPAWIFNRYRREAAALRRVRASEHFHLGDLGRLYISNVVSDMAEAARLGRWPRVASEILWFRWLQFWGTYRGFRLSGPLTSELKRAFYYPPDGAGAGRTARRDATPIDYRAAGIRLPGEPLE